MCNSQNVDIIVKRFLLALSATYDQFQRQSLIDRICEVAERSRFSPRLTRRFAPNPSWYINTMTEVFAFGGRQVKQSVETTLIKMLSESQGDAATDKELRCLAVSQLYPLVLDPLAPENLLRVATWIFGEYGHLSTQPSLAEIVEALGNIWHRPGLSTETKSYLLSAFMKISAQTETIPSIASVMVRECVQSHNTELVQQAMEFREMCKSGAAVFLAALPAKQDTTLVVDPALHFLDSYVMEGRLAGMKDYEEHDLSDEEDKGLKTDAYEAPPEPVPAHTPVALEPKVERKEDGFLDFSTISGSFGNKPTVETITKPTPAAEALFKGVDPAAADLFGGMETSTSASDLFGGMETTKEASVEERSREKEAAALFGGLVSAPAKKTKKPVFSPPSGPVNPLFAPPAPVAEVPAPVAEVPAPAPFSSATPAASAPAVSSAPPAPASPADDLFAGMNNSPSGDMFELMDMSAPASVEPPIDMLQCALSPAYKIFQKDPSGPLALLCNDSHVHLAWKPIYRVRACSPR